MKLDKKFIKRNVWDEDSRRVTTIHRFFDFAESGQVTSFEMFNAGLSRQIFIMKNGDIRRYQIRSDWKKFVEGLERFFNNPARLNYAHKHMQADSKLFISWLKKNCRKSTLQKFSNKELAKILMVRRQRHLILLGWQWFGFIGKYAIKKVLQNRLKKYSMTENEIGLIFVHKRSISIVKEELYAKKAAYKMQQKALSKTTIEKMLNSHLKRFGHIVVYDETNNRMSRGFLKKRLEKYASNKYLKNEINNEYSNFRKNTKAYNIFLSKYKFSKKDRDLIIFANDFAHFMELRNEFRAFAAVYSKDLYELIAKRLSLSINELLCFNDYEIYDALLGKKIISQNEAKKRNKLSATIVVGSDYLIFTGKEAKEINDMVIKQYNQVEIKGYSANRGVATGKVKIVIDNKDVGKVKSGEILVSPMTEPVWLLAMKKAVAIVTDEGGALCHAAVIARELNIPCVVGTKVATQVLRDGDLVEVDANKGIIKIIKKIIILFC